MLITCKLQLIPKLATIRGMNPGENISLVVMVNEEMSGRRMKIFILIADMNRKRIEALS
jgi:hypothetical protein